MGTYTIDGCNEMFLTLQEELLQAEVITTECGKIMRFPNLDVPDVWEVFNNDGEMRKGTIYECLTFLYPSEIK